MADTLESAAPTRRRRSDARRSIDAIIGAARTVLGERPDASMEDIAAAAGVTRQTVYAHFPSRDALILALLDAAGAETLAAIDAARLDTAPPAEALARFLDMCWQLLDRFPVLLDPALIRIPRPSGPDPHDAATAMLERLIQRGQRTGDFDRALNAELARRCHRRAHPHRRRTSRGRAPHHRCGGDHAPGEHTATVRCHRA